MNEPGRSFVSGVEDGQGTEAAQWSSKTFSVNPVLSIVNW